jgi:hypothetical protein
MSDARSSQRKLAARITFKSRCESRLVQRRYNDFAAQAIYSSKMFGR